MAGYRKYSCKYPGCTSGYIPNKGHANKHFFTFPKNLKLHELWRNACKIEDPVLLMTRIDGLSVLREKEILLADLKFQIIEEKRGTDARLTSKNFTNVSKI
ncbi:hypothetical protein TcasGA2_TC002250 [Tribolium castaneum]|uniref:Uncharacterized protein n=1 Tax=Tribolium castaneum TaxID=7070 RepID=D7EHW2_TRICA|nr:hypothetical protein TcasGA2_TC002250 [Tribolium castaneum]